MWFNEGSATFYNQPFPSYDKFSETSSAVLFDKKDTQM